MLEPLKSVRSVAFPTKKIFPPLAEREKVDCDMSGVVERPALELAMR